MAAGLFFAGFIFGGFVVRFMTLRGIRPFHDAKTYVIPLETIEKKPFKSIFRGRGGSVSKLGVIEFVANPPLRLAVSTRLNAPLAGWRWSPSTLRPPLRI